MAKAGSFPTPIPEIQELRALELMSRIPVGCALFPVMDDRSDPHLRRGEIAVVDTADRDPQHGEVYVIEWSSGSRCITQLIGPGFSGFSSSEKDHWWTGALTSRESVPGFGELRMIDGPRSKAGLQKALVGRVIGIFESLPIEVSVSGT
jgi:hypothetical protein